MARDDVHTVITIPEYINRDYPGRDQLPNIDFGQLGVGAARFLREIEIAAQLQHPALVAWLTRFADQGFSLTDAVSFVVMTRRRSRTALTIDHHFAVAGFSMVPAAAHPAGKKRPARRRG